MITKETAEQSIEDQKLLLQMSKNSFDLPLNLNNEYAALTEFRQDTVRKFQEIHKPYQNTLKQSFIYRSIFIGLGALFFFLAFYIYQQSINWLPYSLLFAHNFSAKNLVFTICLIFSASAFGFTFLISAEKEALQQLIKRTKRKLARIYNKQNYLMELSGNPADLKRSKKLKKVYEDTLHKVEEIEEATELLFAQIAKSKNSVCKKTTELFNQALLETNDNLHIVINKFKKMTLFFQS